MSVSLLCMHHIVTLGLHSQVSQDLQAKLLGEGGDMAMVISLCVCTHLSEEVSRPVQWFSDLARHQVHLHTGQKQILGPLPNLLYGTLEGRIQESVILMQ